MTKATRGRALFPIMLMALGASGCGGGDDGNDRASSSAPPAQQSAAERRSRQKAERPKGHEDGGRVTARDRRTKAERRARPRAGEPAKGSPAARKRALAQVRRQLRDVRKRRPTVPPSSQRPDSQAKSRGGKAGIVGVPKPLSARRAARCFSQEGRRQDSAAEHRGRLAKCLGISRSALAQFIEKGCAALARRTKRPAAVRRGCLAQARGG